MRIILKFTFLLIFASTQFFIFFNTHETEAQVVGNLTFPVIDNLSLSFRDDFGDPRAEHTHEGIDIFSKKMTPLVAVADGTIRRINYPEASWGYAVILRDSSGYSYWYLHMNNDTPGTDDGLGGAMNAYAPYIEGRNKVAKGQLIGWVGDSGNAEATTSHVHFEIHPPSGGVINPYSSLQSAQKIKTPIDPPEINDELLPFGEFNGGASVDYGNFDNANNHEIVAGAGPGGTPHVRLMTKDDKKIGTFYAYDENFSGGIDVAAGDLDGDGIDEIITAPGPGGGPHIKMFRVDGMPYTTEGFFAYTPSFTGGVNVAAADIDNDGKDEIITGAGPGGGPHVRIFEGDGTPISDGFFAYPADFLGGVDVSATDATATESSSIITGAGPGGGPHVKIFDKNGTEKGDFYAYDEAFWGGVRVSVGKINASSSSSSSYDYFKRWFAFGDYDQYGRQETSSGDWQILTSPYQHGGADIRIYNLEGSLIEKSQMFENWWQGGYDVAAGEGITFVSTTNGDLSYLGGRRASIQEGP